MDKMVILGTTDLYFALQRVSAFNDHFVHSLDLCGLSDCDYLRKMRRYRTYMNLRFIIIVVNRQCSWRLNEKSGSGQIRTPLQNLQVISPGLIEMIQ